MHDNSDLTIARTSRVLNERLRPAIHSRPMPLSVAAYRVGGEPVPVAEALAAPYEPIEPGTPWGRAWDTTWFRVAGAVPADFAGRRVEALVDLGFDPALNGFQAEGLAYCGDGTPVRGLHPRAQWLPVARVAAGGEAVDFYIEGAANPVVLGHHGFRPTSLGAWVSAGDELLYRFRGAHLAVFEETVFDLVHDVEVLLQLAQNLPGDSTRRAHILAALGRALDRLDLQHLAASAPASRAELAATLASPAAATSHRLSAVGHSHIDSAWLWPLRETVRKVARTATSIVALLDEYPEFVVAMPAAQHYAWLKQHRPEVYAVVKRAVATGRLVPVGGMWVEPDAVLPSGESLIRQMAYGQRFFAEEFGVTSNGAWLPDSFGYSAALPQLLVGAGFDWFLTQKISWNETDTFPHHTFWWEGLDGTRIFTHFPPMDTYCAELSGTEVARAARQFREKAHATSSLAPTGWGDGGGGPTREMIARAARLADLEGSGRLAWEHPDAFFARAKAELPDPPVWRGELYLELHRGTYTSQHAMKQGNRRCEALLREAELWSATATVRTGRPYPAEVLDDAWREVLLLQFHDILPGSSIAWVHEEARGRYARLETVLEGLVTDALAALGTPATGTAGAGAGVTGVGEGGGLVANASPVPQAGVTPGAVGVAVQGPHRWLRREGEHHVLESDQVRFVVDADGLLVSAYDRARQREVIPAGARGNLPQLHQDFPKAWDAWDVDEAYRGRVEDLGAAESVRAEGDGLLIRRVFGDSSLEQRLSLADDGRTLLIDCRIDWHETEKFLKLAFPVDVFTDQALAETQFGYQSRPTHDNTSWDHARFETQAQRWFLVGEPDFGVAFLNDCAPGFDVTRRDRAGRITQDARFSVLRAPRFPDPRTDQGVQTMRLGLQLGATPATATAVAWELANPIRPVSGTPVRPLVTVSHPAVLTSAVKLADDRSGDLVVRVYEALGNRARSVIGVADGVTDACRADLLERPGAPLPITPTADGGGAVTLDLRPFEVTTVRFRRA